MYVSVYMFSHRHVKQFHPSLHSILCCCVKTVKTKFKRIWWCRFRFSKLICLWRLATLFEFGLKRSLLFCYPEPDDSEAHENFAYDRVIRGFAHNRWWKPRVREEGKTFKKYQKYSVWWWFLEFNIKFFFVAIILSLASGVFTHLINWLHMYLPLPISLYSWIALGLAPVR